jgi:2-keto-4-pentenoate hydratase/2-oxohepta-3-ene-1,7-dioic acid hydratase in catechol pathway
MAFKLLTYVKEKQRPRAGILVEEETVIDVKRALDAQGEVIDGLDPTSVLSLLDHWDSVRPTLWEISKDKKTPDGAIAGPLSEIQLTAPILYPPTIYCAAANYADHRKEMSNHQMPDKRTARPYFFHKTPHQSVIGPGETILIPYPEAKVDWEAEIGVVIGRRCRNVVAAEAMGYVAGFTIVQDVSDRARLPRKDWNFGLDWFGGKSFDTSAPMGPWMTPAELIPDPHNLSIQLRLNDDLMQDSSSRLMYFTIPEQIEYLSECRTLLPGDVIATGTPSGVGHPQGKYMKPGDTVTITIEGLGTIRNPVKAGY